MPPAARGAIVEVVAPFLEERYRDYVSRYGFEPKGPVTFELYGDPHDFAVRTVGLPTIGVAGVCFGRVITSQSPTNHAFNWGMVLAHELAHVFAIELSRSRVPRWFTEGLSEVETMRARPEWTRHDDFALYGAWRRGELPPLVSLSNAFSNARSADEAARAYAHAALAVDFLERRFGFPALRAALAAYGRGQRDDVVLEQLAGMPAAALEQAFRADIAGRFARYEGQYLPTQTLTGTARTGLAALAKGDLDGARRALEQARAATRPSVDDQAGAMFLAGEIALARRDAAAAVAAFEGLLLLGPPSHDGYDVRVRLGLAEIHRQQLRRGRGASPPRRRLRSDSRRAARAARRALRSPAARGRPRAGARGRAPSRPPDRRGGQGGRARVGEGGTHGARSRARTDRRLRRSRRSRPARGPRPRPRRDGQARRRRRRLRAGSGLRRRRPRVPPPRARHPLRHARQPAAEPTAIGRRPGSEAAAAGNLIVKVVPRPGAHSTSICPP